MTHYIMKDNNKFQGPYKTAEAANIGIVQCEKYFHTGLTVEEFKPSIIKRQFKKENNKRYVLSKVSRLHTFHIECASDEAVETWCLTQHTCCAKCHEPLYKKSI